jgi:hypothetical protein
VVSMLGINTTADESAADADLLLAPLPPVVGGVARRRSSAPLPPRTSNAAAEAQDSGEAIAEYGDAGGGGEWEDDGPAEGVSDDEEDYGAAGEADDAERRMQVNVFYERERDGGRDRNRDRECAKKVSIAATKLRFQFLSTNLSPGCNGRAGVQAELGDDEMPPGAPLRRGVGGAGAGPGARGALSEVELGQVRWPRRTAHPICRENVLLRVACVTCLLSPAPVRAIACARAMYDGQVRWPWRPGCEEGRTRTRVRPCVSARACALLVPSAWLVCPLSVDPRTGRRVRSPLRSAHTHASHGYRSHGYPSPSRI